ncbi:MAG TPA: hypothetical protein VGX96_10755 [Candidatus Elarobacter sp.]|nr:hypothetical protein [Candidatus Elarobacter sp.]
MEAAESVLSQLTRRLFGQLWAAGRLAAAGWISSDRLRDEIFPRALVARFLAERISDVAPVAKLLPDAATLTPYIEFPLAFAPGGWLRDGHVNGKQYVDALLDTWLMFGAGPTLTKGFVEWVVRAMLRVLHRDGVLAAVAYVIDLQRDGVIRTDVAIEGAWFVLRARRAVADDTAVASLFLDLDDAGERAWLEQRFKSIDANPWPVVRGDLDDDLWAIIERVDDEIANVRTAASYDDWIAGQTFLDNLTTFAKAVFRRLNVADALPFAAALHRFEEVRADAGGLLASVSALSRSGEWPYTPIYGSAVNFEVMGAPDREAIERALEQRAIVPDELQERFWRDERGVAGLAPQWKGFTLALAPIVGRAVFGDKHFATRRRLPFTEEQVRIAADNSNIFVGLDVEDAEIRAMLLALCTAGDHEETRERLHERGVAGERIADAVAVLLSRCAVVEITVMVDAMTQRLASGDRPGALAVVATAIERYPWYADAYDMEAELGGLGGNPVASAADALLLDPMQPKRWRTLADALQTRGHAADAGIARTIGDRLTASVPRP